MISETTQGAVVDEMLARELGDLRVVGRKQPVRVYELEGFAGESEPVFWGDYRRALDLCKAGRLAEAREAMDKLQAG